MVLLIRAVFVPVVLCFFSAFPLQLLKSREGACSDFTINNLIMGGWYSALMLATWGLLAASLYGYFAMYPRIVVLKSVALLGGVLGSLFTSLLLQFELSTTLVAPAFVAVFVGSAMVMEEIATSALRRMAPRRDVK